MAPNFVDDGDQQLDWTLLPVAASINPWRNVLDPPITRFPRPSDSEVLEYVRRSNYFDAGGNIVLANSLNPLPSRWDEQHDGHWDGFVPDAWFRFDEHGFDHRPDGTATGWRAFAYAPFLGAFFPSNGSMDDVMIRLDPVFQRDAHDRENRRVYETNLAVVEALISRADVPIEAVDERDLGVDLDLDGKLGVARRITFDETRMHYVGRAHREERDGIQPIAPGLFPLGTEFLHSVRYLDVVDLVGDADDGDDSHRVKIAARMKELRYARKARWFSTADLKAVAARELIEQAESPTGAREVVWEVDHGIYNGQGWLLQGFIEDAGGSLRPQTREETVFCAGCHGGIGATVDSIFSFARKLGPDSPARGWFHWTQHDLRNLPEPRRSDGQFEYSLYLRETRGGDDQRENAEVRRKFFDAHGALRPAPVARLHTDIATLLIPGARRALDLDRATLAVVRLQTFTLGRDPVLGPSRHVYARVPNGQKTGVSTAVPGPSGATSSLVTHSRLRRRAPVFSMGSAR